MTAAVAPNTASRVRKRFMFSLSEKTCDGLRAGTADTGRFSVSIPVEAELPNGILRNRSGNARQR